MKIEKYDKMMNQTGLSILMFLIWLIGTIAFFGLMWIISWGFVFLFGGSIPSQFLLILAAIIGGPFSIFGTLYFRSSSKYSSSGDGFDFRDWWMIYGHQVDFGDKKTKSLNINEVNKWASENCNHFWRRSVKQYYSTWIFKDESEAMAFKLRWS